MTADRSPDSADAATAGLPASPVIDVGPDFPMETLERELPRAHRLLDAATRIVPMPDRRSATGLRQADRRDGRPESTRCSRSVVAEAALASASLCQSRAVTVQACAACFVHHTR